MSKQLDHAIALASKGFKVFPLPPGEKLPKVKWKDVATFDEATIRGWFEKEPNANYGVAFGHGQHALDIDMKGGRDGLASLALHTEIMGDLPDTFTVRTASGGYHQYFNGPAWNSQNLLGDALDIRGGEEGHSGYVLGPGCEVGGKEYTIVNDAPIAAAPEWYLAAARPVKQEIMKAKPGLVLDTPEEVAWVRNHLQVLVEHNDVAIEGQGGNTRANKLFNTILDRAISPEMAYKLVDDIWNEHCWPPFNPYELSILCNSAARTRQNEIGAKTEPPGSETFAAMAQNVEPPPAEAKRKNRFMNAAQQLALPEPTWLIPDLLPQASIVFLSALKGSFKSFLALDMSLGICTGLETFGSKPVTTGLVMYGDHESITQIARLHAPAWKVAKGLARDEEVGFYLGQGPRMGIDSTHQPWMDDLQEIQQQEGKPIKMIVHDTYSATMLGWDENDATDANKYIDYCRGLIDAFGCTVLNLAHYGKDMARGMRGSSAAPNGGDTILDQVRVEGTRQVSLNVKHHRGAEERKHPFRFIGEPWEGSLVFRLLTAEEGIALVKGRNPYDGRTMAGLLREAGHHGDEQAVSTKAFAMLVRPQGESESNLRYDAELDHTIKELKKRGAPGGELAHLAFGKGDKMAWCYPPGLLEDET